MNHIKIRSIVLFLIIYISYCNTQAQTFNLRSVPTGKIQLGFNFEKPFFKNSLGFSTLSGVYQFSVNVPVSSKLNIVSDIPFITTKYEVDFGSFIGKYKFDQSGFGNIFIGLQTNGNPFENKRSIFTFGLYLPTASEDVAINGLYINYYNFQEFFPNSLGLYFNYAYHNLPSEGFIFGLDIGPNIIISTIGEGPNPELFIHYGISAGYRVNKFLIKSEFYGIALMSGDVQNFADRFVNLFDIGVQWMDDYVKPKLFYSIYLDRDINRIMDGMLGVGVTVSID